MLWKYKQIKRKFENEGEIVFDNLKIKFPNCLKQKNDTVHLMQLCYLRKLATFYCIFLFLETINYFVIRK